MPCDYYIKDFIIKCLKVLFKGSWTRQQNKLYFLYTYTCTCICHLHLHVYRNLELKTLYFFYFFFRGGGGGGGGEEGGGEEEGGEEEGGNKWIIYVICSGSAFVFTIGVSCAITFCCGANKETGVDTGMFGVIY